MASPIVTFCDTPGLNASVPLPCRNIPAPSAAPLLNDMDPPPGFTEPALICTAPAASDTAGTAGEAADAAAGAAHTEVSVSTTPCANPIAVVSDSARTTAASPVGAACVPV